MSGHSSESQRQGAPPGLWAAEWRGDYDRDVHK